MSERNGRHGYFRRLGSQDGREGLGATLIAGGRSVARFVTAIAIIHVDGGRSAERHAKRHLSRCGCVRDRARSENRKQQEGKDTQQPFHGRKLTLIGRAVHDRVVADNLRAFDLKAARLPPDIWIHADKKASSAVRPFGRTAP
ncbi:hypothetical protein [Nitratireductor luteus]|uniref:hypothetical protein n=1 Tax=Nitratireductor luteus TaxID=2976980 RepID=UPI00223F05AC|nr:hypothetical protein [Nitratireductor luteus]